MRLLRTHTFLLVRRIVLLYVVLALCRVVFYICNRQLKARYLWANGGLCCAEP